ncbi:MAG: carbohydrate-binding protein [Bacillota bacterium]
MNSFFKRLLGIEEHDQEVGIFESPTDNYVSWEPVKVSPGETVHLNYHGLLKNSGAGEIYLHYGFDSWNHNINTLKMARNEQGDFVADVPTGDNREMNFCFKDEAGNWDNNNGWDWTLHLE